MAGLVPVPLLDVAHDVPGASGPVVLAREDGIHRHLPLALQSTRNGLVIREDGAEECVLDTVVARSPRKLPAGEGMMP